MPRTAASFAAGAAAFAGARGGTSGVTDGAADAFVAFENRAAMIAIATNAMARGRKAKKSTIPNREFRPEGRGNPYFEHGPG